jgi:hypothetical protein
VLVKYNSVGTSYHCRVILDNGSQLNFITENLAQLLGSYKSPIKLFVPAITGKATAGLERLVVPKITGNLSSTNIDVLSWKFPQTIALADPQFGTPQQIDVLIGAELFCELFTNFYHCSRKSFLGE